MFTFYLLMRLSWDMLRSVLLSVEFKVTSYTKWTADLKENHLPATISAPVPSPKEMPKKPDKKGKRPRQWRMPPYRSYLSSSSCIPQQI